MCLVGHSAGVPNLRWPMSEGCWLSTTGAAREIDMPVQRPTAVPLESLVAEGVRGELCRWTERLGNDLGRIGHRDVPRLVVHGDFTPHNVFG